MDCINLNDMDNIDTYMIDDDDDYDPDDQGWDVIDSELSDYILCID